MSSIVPTKFENFDDFWPYYLSQHSDERCRMAHFGGTSSALSFLIVSVVTESLYLIPLAVIVGYGWAWFGHFKFEKNLPATFKHPIFSLRGDIKMYVLMLNGQLQAEIEKYKK